MLVHTLGPCLSLLLFMEKNMFVKQCSEYLNYADSLTYALLFWSLVLMQICVNEILVMQALPIVVFHLWNMSFNQNGFNLQSLLEPQNSGLFGSQSSGYNDGDQLGSFSGHGGDCCPLVIDPLTYAALIGFIGLATYFFNVQIAASMLARSFPWPFNAGWVIHGRNFAITLKNSSCTVLSYKFVLTKNVCVSRTYCTNFESW